MKPDGTDRSKRKPERAILLSDAMIVNTSKDRRGFMEIET